MQHLKSKKKEFEKNIPSNVTKVLSKTVKQVEICLEHRGMHFSNLQKWNFY